jgi:chromosome segregation ATPase
MHCISHFLQNVAQEFAKIRTDIQRREEAERQMQTRLSQNNRQTGEQMRTLEQKVTRIERQQQQQQQQGGGGGGMDRNAVEQMLTNREERLQNGINQISRDVGTFRQQISKLERQQQQQQSRIAGMLDRNGVEALVKRNEENIRRDIENV